MYLIVSPSFCKMYLHRGYIAVIALIWSGKALKFSDLYNLLTSVLLTCCIAMFSESHSLHTSYEVIMILSCYEVMHSKRNNVN